MQNLGLHRNALTWMQFLQCNLVHFVQCARRVHFLKCNRDVMHCNTSLSRISLSIQNIISENRNVYDTRSPLGPNISFTLVLHFIDRDFSLRSGCSNQLNLYSLVVTKSFITFSDILTIHTLPLFNIF